MAYCVKCGVELDESAKKCALCSTPLVLPQGLELDQGAATPFPEKVQLPAEVRRRYLVFFVSMVMLIPNIVLIITNFLLPSTGLWALYVASSSALAWVLFVYPFLWKRQKPYLLITVDALATALYIYVFYALGKEKGWFFYLALPIVCLLTLSLYITTFWIRRARRDWPEIINMILLQIA
jgi:cation transport ATPase